MGLRVWPVEDWWGDWSGTTLAHPATELSCRSQWFSASTATVPKRFWLNDRRQSVAKRRTRARPLESAPFLSPKEGEMLANLFFGRFSRLCRFKV